MGGFSPIHLLVLAVVAILLLGGGRFSNLMGDVAKGVKNFKEGMTDEANRPATPPPSQIAAQPAATTPAATTPAAAPETVAAPSDHQA